MDKSLNTFSYMKKINCGTLENTAVKLQSKEIMEDKIRGPLARNLRCADLLLQIKNVDEALNSRLSKL